MKITDYLLTELDREANRTRAVLLATPPDTYEWKPHEKSMKFGWLADMVAIIPTWIAMQVTKDELDIAPKEGSNVVSEPKTTSAALVQALDAAVIQARDALTATTDEHLETNWQLKVKDKVVQEAPRFQMIQDTFCHWAHHRGQMTVYLRLMGAKVPGTYGPSADDQSFR
jgi:uncharacterized damage-inducible protein DinB